MLKIAMKRRVAAGLLGVGLILGGCASGPEKAVPDDRETYLNVSGMGAGGNLVVASLRQTDRFDLSFAQDSVELSAESIQTLASSAHMARHWMKDGAVRVEIRASRVPSDAADWKKALSERRIENVRHVLLAFGLPETVLVIKPSDDPVSREAESAATGQVNLTLVRVANDQVAALINSYP